MKKTAMALMLILLGSFLIACNNNTNNNNNDNDEPDKEIELDMNFNLSENIISWNSYNNAIYEIIINEEKKEINVPFYYVETFPLTIQVKVITEEFTSTYSKSVTFNEPNDNLKNITLNINKEKDNINANINLLYDPEFYYLLNSNFEIVNLNNYEYNTTKIINNDKEINYNYINLKAPLFNSLNEDEVLYLLTNKELVKIKINYIDTLTSYIVNPIVYTDFKEDVVFFIELAEAELIVGESLVKKEHYEITSNMLIINKEFLESLFQDNDRKSFILSVVFKSASGQKGTTLHIYKAK